MRRLLIAAAAGLMATAACAKDPKITYYDATVIQVRDGDTVKVRIAAWANTPIEEVAVRIYGIDTPEKRMPPGKCDAEVEKGKAASEFAKTLVKTGETVKVGYIKLDKYGGRIVGTITLPNGKDWTKTFIDNGMAKPYFGATKSSWCN